MWHDRPSKKTTPNASASETQRQSGDSAATVMMLVDGVGQAQAHVNSPPWSDGSTILSTLTALGRLKNLTNKTLSATMDTRLEETPDI